MDEVEVVVAHGERATVRVGDVFLKIDGDARRADVEVAAMALAPVPTAPVLWRRPPVLALGRVAGTPLGRLGRPSTASAAAWTAAGAAMRKLHDTPPPDWPSTAGSDSPARLDAECEWLLAHDVLPADLVRRNRELAETVVRPHQPVFVHGDLQVDHVFVDGGEVTGVLDWSEAGRGDGLYDLAVLTVGHPERLADVLAGYGDADVELVGAYWSVRGLLGVRWLVEHGYDPFRAGCEVEALRAAVAPRG